MRLWGFCIISLLVFCLTGTAQQNGFPTGRGAVPPPADSITIGGGWQRFTWGPGLPTVGPFTFTADTPVTFEITDLFCPGDTFMVLDNGAFVGATNIVAGFPRLMTYSCSVDDPDIGFTNPTLSHGTFTLPAGAHSITIQLVNNPFNNGGAAFRVDAANPGPGTTVSPRGMVMDNSTSTAIIFDADADVVLGTVPVPKGLLAGDCSITSDQKLGFAPNSAGQISVIDMSAMTLASGPNVIPIGNSGEDTSISIDGKFLLVTDGCCGNQPLSIVDIASRSQVATFRFPADPISVETCSDGSVLVNTFPSSLYRLTLNASGAPSDTGDLLALDTDDMNVSCSPGGQSGVAVNISGSIQSFKIPGLVPVDTRSLGAAGISAVFSPAGDRFYVRSVSTVKGFTFDQATGALGASPFLTIPIAAANAFFGIDQMAIHPNGTKLYVSQGGNLNIYDAMTGSLLKTLMTRSGALTGVCLASPSLSK